MKTMITLLLAVLISACSSTNKQAINNDATSSMKTAEAEFLEENGPLRLKFDEAGKWISIQSTATAPIDFDTAAAREMAFQVAAMRAKRNVVEFLSNDIKSTKSVQTISKSFIKHIGQIDSANSVDSSEGGGEEDAGGNAASNNQATKEMRQKANTLAMVVRESINDNAQGILKGAHIAERKVAKDSQHVSVTVVVTQQSIRTADQVRKAMSAL